MASKAKNTNAENTVPAATSEAAANTVAEATITDVANVTDAQLPQESEPAALIATNEQAPEAEAVIGLMHNLYCAKLPM